MHEDINSSTIQQSAERGTYDFTQLGARHATVIDENSEDCFATR